jgi:hypothetical protein
MCSGKKKERQDETQFTTKVDGFLSFIPSWMLMYFFAGISHPVYDQTQGSGGAVFFLLTLRIALMLQNKANNGRVF